TVRGWRSAVERAGRELARRRSPKPRPVPGAIGRRTRASFHVLDKEALRPPHKVVQAERDLVGFLAIRVRGKNQQPVRNAASDCRGREPAGFLQPRPKLAEDGQMAART